MNVRERLIELRDRKRPSKPEKWLIDPELVHETIDKIEADTRDYELAFRRFNEEQTRADRLEAKMRQIVELANDKSATISPKLLLDVIEGRL